MKNKQSKSEKPVVTVQPGTEVKVATKMDNILASEKRLLAELVIIREIKATHKAWLKSEQEKA